MNFHESNTGKLRRFHVKIYINFLRNPANLLLILLFYPGIFMETHEKYLFFHVLKYNRKL